MNYGELSAGIDRVSSVRNCGELSAGMDWVPVSIAQGAASYDWNSVPKAQAVEASTKSTHCSPPTRDSIIDLQTSSGYFSFTDATIPTNILNCFTADVDRKLREHLGSGRRIFFRHKNFINTILIIIFVESHYPESSELYELVIQKARGWLRKQLRNNEKLDEFEDIARGEMHKETDKISKDDVD